MRISSGRTATVATMAVLLSGCAVGSAHIAPAPSRPAAPSTSSPSTSATAAPSPGPSTASASAPTSNDRPGTSASPSVSGDASTPPDPLPAATPTDGPDAGTPGGAVPVIRRIQTNDPVIFITIDDGYSHDQDVVNLLRARRIPVTPFLTEDAVRDHRDFFTRITAVTDQVVQDHTVSHPHLNSLGRERQREEICGAADTYERWYGTRPWLFRPPYGEYGRTTRQVARECGMEYLVLWDVSLPHRVIRYASGNRLQRGDIVLVHWRPDLARDLPVVLDAAAAAGLRVAALQDYLPRAASRTG